MLISVVVCTRNRREILAGCLRSLAQQSVPGESYEVIVADNDSSDGTRALVEEYSRKEPNFRYCHEARRGANHARNAGVAIARGSYLAFIDDDAIAAGDWLAGIRAFIARHPEVAVFGGPFDSYALVPVPHWFPPEYGTLSLGAQERELEIGREWLTATNLIVSADAFRSVGGFHEKLGNVENGVFYFGEETRLQLDLSALGHAIYYVPSVRVSHLIRADKLHLSYLLRAVYRMGRNHGLTFKVRRSLPELLLSLAVTLVKAGYKTVARREPLKGRLYHALWPVFHEAGAVVERLSASFQPGSKSDNRDL